MIPAAFVGERSELFDQEPSLENTLQLLDRRKVRV